MSLKRSVYHRCAMVAIDTEVVQIRAYKNNGQRHKLCTK